MLTDAECRTAKPGSKPFKLSDAGGLYLHVSPAGSKGWRLAYRYGGKQRVMALGDYPEKSLPDARLARELAKEHLRRGDDPAGARGAVLSPTPSNAFGRFADIYIERQAAKGRSEATLKKARWILGYRDDPADSDYVEGMSAKLRPLAIASIKPPDLLAVWERIEAKGHLETARRMKVLHSGVFRTAVMRGACEHDPTISLKGALAPVRSKHRAAIIEPKAFGRLLLAIDGYVGHPTIKIALQLLALTFPRPGELRYARWASVDLRNCVWTIPAANTKMRKEHRIPLAPQAVALFEQLREFTGDDELCFPSLRSAAEPLSNNTFNAALRAMGIDGETHVAHGFRSSASSLLNERSPFTPDVIERALGHGEADRVRAAYHRAEHWEERVRLAKWWADYCDKLRKAARGRREIARLTG